MEIKYDVIESSFEGSQSVVATFYNTNHLKEYIKTQKNNNYLSVLKTETTEKYIPMEFLDIERLS